MFNTDFCVLVVHKLLIDALKRKTLVTYYTEKLFVRIYVCVYKGNTMTNSQYWTMMY